MNVVNSLHWSFCRRILSRWWICGIVCCRCVMWKFCGKLNFKVCHLYNTAADVPGDCGYKCILMEICFQNSEPVCSSSSQNILSKFFCQDCRLF